MKKTAAVILAICMVLALNACDKNGTDLSSETESLREESTKETEPLQEESTKETDPPETSESSETEDSRETEETTAEPEKPFRIAKEDLPRIDGSTAMVPLAQALLSEILEIPYEEAGELVHFNRTTTAYFNLINGQADLLIIGEANDDVFAEKERQNFEWEREPVGMDAFVFVVNANNPVDSITIEEARKIYTGEIVSWKELGGEDLKIDALQRNETAGSQTLMKKWVMQGEPMAEAPKEYVIGGMGELMEAVKSYDNSASAIGYSVYYYAEEMRMAEGLKLLKLNGVEPCDETIRSGEYPILNPEYAAIKKDAPEDCAARAIYDFLLSEDGQKLVAEQGYVSMIDVGAEPEKKPLAGSRYYEAFTDHLIPQDDYGPLIPYIGRRTEEFNAFTTGDIYGLMTMDGRVVTDPVYADCTATEHYLLLTKTTMNHGEKEILFAASDGSSVSDRTYTEYFVNLDRTVTLSDADRNIVLMDADGRITMTITPEMHQMNEDEWNEFLYGLTIDEGAGVRAGDWVRLRSVEDGYSVEVFSITENRRMKVSLDEWIERMPERPEALQKLDEKVFSKHADGWIFDRYEDFIYNKYETDGRTLVYTWYDHDGKELFKLEADHYSSVSFYRGIYGVVTKNEAKYYRISDRQPVFETGLFSEPDEEDPLKEEP